MDLLKQSITAVLALALSLAAVSLACADTRGRSPSDAEQAESLPGALHAEHFTQGLFWKIEKEDDLAGYIFGTIHLNDKEITTIPQKVKDVISQSQGFAMESYPDDYSNGFTGGPTNTAYNSTGLSEYIELQGDRTLPDVIGEKLYHRVVEILTGIGFKEQDIRHLKPWVAMHSISIRSPAKGEILDNKLLEYAAPRVRDFYRLEFPEELMAAFWDMPMDAQASLLKDAVNNYPHLNTMLKDMRQAYLDEDLQAMANISTSFIPHTPEDLKYRDDFLKHAIYIRNIAMQHRMRKPLREGPAFIAIGALHLYGDQSVLHLLEEDGYTLTRVTIDRTGTKQ